MGSPSGSTKVKQLGLYALSDKEAENFVKRVADYNKSHIGNAVNLDISAHENGDEMVSKPHYKLDLTFPSREIQENFWTN
jgi:hypothetical protein